MTTSRRSAPRAATGSCPMASMPAMTASAVRPSCRPPHGLTVTFGHAGQEHTVDLPLIGTFQAGNALCALALAVATGADLSAAVGALNRLEGAPGRMQRVATHPKRRPGLRRLCPHARRVGTPCLRPCARTLQRTSFVVVFGCRRRPRPRQAPALMGRWPRTAWPTSLIVTDDNPRRRRPGGDPPRRCWPPAPKASIEIGDRHDGHRHMRWPPSGAG